MKTMRDQDAHKISENDIKENILSNQNQPYVPEFLFTNSDVELINSLFNSLRGTCNASGWHWPNQDALDNCKREWLKAFVQAGMNSEQQIGLGLKKLRQRTSTPGTSSAAFLPPVGDFISWCKPTHEELGLPSKENAYELALEFISQYNTVKPKIHDVIRHTIKQISEYTLRTLPEQKTRAMFYATYEIAAQQFANGKLEIIPKMINQDDPKKHSIVLPQYENIKNPKEAMQAIMKQLRGGL